jgi:hypothetical protein
MQRKKQRFSGVIKMERKAQTLPLEDVSVQLLLQHVLITAIVADKH